MKDTRQFKFVVHEKVRCVKQAVNWGLEVGRIYRVRAIDPSTGNVLVYGAAGFVAPRYFASAERVEFEFVKPPDAIQEPIDTVKLAEADELFRSF